MDSGILVNYNNNRNMNNNWGSSIPSSLPRSYPNTTRIPVEREDSGTVLPFAPSAPNTVATPAENSNFTGRSADYHVVTRSQKKRRLKPKEMPKSVIYDLLRRGGDGEITHTLPEGVYEPTETLPEALENNGYRTSNKRWNSSKLKKQDDDIQEELQILIREIEKYNAITEDIFEDIFEGVLKKPGAPLEVNIDTSILGKRRRKYDPRTNKQSIKYRKINALKKIGVYKEELEPLEEIRWGKRTLKQRETYRRLRGNIGYLEQKINQFNVEIQRDQNENQKRTINKLNRIVSKLSESPLFLMD